MRGSRPSFYGALVVDVRLDLAGGRPRDSLFYSVMSYTVAAIASPMELPVLDEATLRMEATSRCRRRCWMTMDAYCKDTMRLAAWSRTPSWPHVLTSRMYYAQRLLIGISHVCIAMIVNFINVNT
jgi:hypothetical protein